MQFKTLALVGLLLLTGCVKEYHNHGYSFSYQDTESIQARKSTYNDVLDELGSPTAESAYGNKTLYYISNKTEQVAFLDPKVVEQRILEIEFDKNDVVSGVNEYTITDQNKIDFASGQTNMYGNTLSPIEQILGNVGKYNKKQKAF